jgi:hypothetical protein
MNLSEETIQILRDPKNESIKSELIRATKKSYPTICRWITTNSVQLTQKACLIVLTRELGVSEEELFETEKTN